jgi:hypothetical protein
MLTEAIAPKGQWLPIVILVAFVSLHCLLNGNLGQVNETNILPFARQHIDSSWLPNDWYLNQPPGYRVPFIAIFGRMAATFGFLPTSIIGRLLGYTLITSALVFLSRQLKLQFVLLLVAIALFLNINTGFSDMTGAQGSVAREWLFGGIEPKIPAYGLILYAIGFMLSDRLLPMALLLGIATSFHTLVGGWAFLVSVGWLIWHYRLSLFTNIRRLLIGLVLYTAGAVFAFQPIWEQLTEAKSTGRFSASFTYVFIRTPHHLNPLSWDAGWWIKPVLLLLLLAGSTYALHRRASLSGELRSPTHMARLGLAQFTLVSLIPVVTGLIIAPFDHEGKLLQYYLFRFGDLMLPLNTWLLVMVALQAVFAEGRSRKWLIYGCMALLALTCTFRAVTFTEQAIAMQTFPSKPQRVSATMKDFCNWIRTHTPKDAVFVSPPVELDNFHWLAERATIAKFKLVPPGGAGIGEWLQRLSDLSGKIDPWDDIKRTRDNTDVIKTKLSSGYRALTRGRAIALMNRYHADYFIGENFYVDDKDVIHTLRSLKLPIAYQNKEFTLYTRESLNSSVDDHRQWIWDNHS